MIDELLSSMLRSTPELIHTPSLALGLAQAVANAAPAQGTAAAQTTSLGMFAAALADVASKGPDVPA